jgi:hypothetical protein
MVPSVVFDVPKSSPQIDMDTPEGASVYTLKRHRSTFILLRHASAPFRTKWITRWANDVHPQDNLFDTVG